VPGTLVNWYNEDGDLMKCTIYWNVAPSNPEEEQQNLCLAHTSYCFLDLLFDPEDGGGIFIRNVGGFLPDHMALNRACTAFGYIKIFLGAVTVILIPEECRTVSKRNSFFLSASPLFCGQIYSGWSCDEVLTVSPL
jgi:hypothetical protein